MSMLKLAMAGFACLSVVTAAHAEDVEAPLCLVDHGFEPHRAFGVRRGKRKKPRSLRDEALAGGHQARRRIGLVIAKVRQFRRHESLQFPNAGGRPPAAAASRRFPPGGAAY